VIVARYKAVLPDLGMFTSAPQLVVISAGKKAKLSGSVASTCAYISSTIGSDCGWKKYKSIMYVVRSLKLGSLR
jgi:hypothetical protein